MRFPFPLRRILVLLLVLLTVSVFWRVSQNGFVGYDDPDYLSLNPIVSQGLTSQGLAWAFGKVHGEQTYWHPLTWVSHMLDVQLFGLNPGAHHLVSVAFHVANAVLLFFLLESLTGALWRSAVVAALFAVHPLQVESVAWATERKNVLSALFWMLTLLAYVRYAKAQFVLKAQEKSKSPTPRPLRSTEGEAALSVQGAKWWYILSIIFFALGLMCKPAIIPLPGVLALLDFWPLRRFQASGFRSQLQSSQRFSLLSRITRHASRALWLEKIPFVLLAIISAIITLAAHQGLGMLSESAAPPKSLQWSNVFLSYLRYVGKAILPVNLAAFYPFPKAIEADAVVSSLFLLAALSAAAVWQIRKRPYFFVGWCWFLGVLLPTIGIVHVGIQAMADRFAYIPIIGLFVAAVWGVAELFERRNFSMTCRVGCSTLVIFALAVTSWKQIGYWKDDYALFEHARTATRDNYMAYTAVGGVLLKQGEVDQAMNYFTIAQEIEPVFPDVYFSIGVAMSKKGNVAEALKNFQEAVQLKPFYPEAQLNLALMLQTAGRLDESIAAYEDILRAQPYSDQAHLGIGNALLTKGRFDDALFHFRDAIRLNPKSGAAMARLAWILATHPDPKLRNGYEAVQLAERSCKLSGYKHTQTVTTLAAAYAETGQFDLAVGSAEQALNLARSNNETFLIPMIQNLRDHYRARQPYRETTQ